MADTKPKLLLVDDSELVMTMLSDHLASEGFEIHMAEDGAIGYQKAKTVHPDLIITDVQMPNLSGHDLTRKLREDKATQKLPIIMITTLSTMEDRIKGIECGADDFINKPFNKQMLMLKIRNLLKSSALHKQVEASLEEMRKMREKEKYTMEVLGEEILEMAANMCASLGQLETNLTSGGAAEQQVRMAKSAAGSAESLSVKLKQVFKAG